MNWKIEPSALHGEIRVPPSKSHTIRALLIAALADGESTIEHGLLEGDGASGLDAVQGLGATVAREGDNLRIAGAGSDGGLGRDELFLGNSGTSARLFAAAAALGPRKRRFDGDDSLRNRPMKPLLTALGELGATFGFESSNRDIPFWIHGPLRGGSVCISGITSQFVSSLLLSCPLATGDTSIAVDGLHEAPYVRITTWWLDKQGIAYEASDDLAHFKIRGNQRYRPIRQRIPGDFSSATFAATGAAITRSSLRIENVDFTDPQGDREVFDILESMGVLVERDQTGCVVSGGDELQGTEIDLNSMPDALPALAVLGCVASGTTVLRNVKQARIKETDRIAVMAGELAKMGASIEELPDGLRIRQSALRGALVDGHNDHRVVMALALAGLIADGVTVVGGAEAAAVTYPGFARDFAAAGMNILPQEENR